MQHFSFLVFLVFFQCSSFLFIILLNLPPAPSDCLAVCQSVRPPNRLIQTARGAHGSWGVAVAAVGLHALALGVQAWVHQAVGPTSTGGPRAGQQAGGGALTPSIPRRNHGELVGARAGAIIQVGVGLEVLSLVV